MRKTPGRQRNKLVKQTKTDKLLASILCLQQEFSGVILNNLVIKILFLISRSLLGVMVPTFALFPENESDFSEIQKFIKSLTTTFFMDLQCLGILIGCFCVLASLLFCTISFFLEKNLRIVSILVPFFNCLTPILLNFSTQIIFSDSSCSESNSLFLTIAKFESGIIIIILLMISAVYQFFYFSYSIIIVNEVLKIQNQLLSYKQMGVNLLCLIFPIIGVSEQTSLILLICFLILSLANLYSITYWFVYQSHNSSQMHTIICCLEFSFIILILISVSVNEQLLINNFLQVVASTTLFSYLAVNNYVENRNQEILLMEVHDMKTRVEGILYIFLLNKISKCESDEDGNQYQLILMNLKYDHMAVCKNPECFCKTKTGGEFCRKLTLERIQQVIAHFEKDPRMLLSGCFLKLQAYESYADTLSLVNYLEKKIKFQLMEKFIYSGYKAQLLIVLKRKNKAKVVAEIQKVLDLERIVYKTEECVGSLLSKKSSFWATFSKGIFNQEQIQSNFDFQLNLIRKIHKDLDALVDQFGQNFDVINLYGFYILSVELKLVLPNNVKDKIKILEINRNVPFTQLLGNVKDLLKILFRQQCCVFQSEVDKLSMGNITMASQNTQMVMGYQPKGIIGLNARDMMPKSMQAEHDYILEKWCKESSWYNIGVMREIYILHKNRNCFSCNYYVKILQKESSLSLVVALMKKNQSDFMIVNPSGVIDGVGSRFAQLLGEKVCGLPLEFIVENSEKFNLGSREKKSGFMIFMSIKEFQKEVDHYLQEKNKYHIQKEAEELKKNLRENSKKYEIEYQCLPFQMGRLTFMILKLRNFTIYHEDTKLTKDMEMKMIKDEESEQGGQTTFLIGQKQSMQEGNQGGDEEGLLNCGISVNSSHAKQDYTIVKSLNKLQNVYFDVSKVSDRIMLPTMILVATFCICLIICLSVIFYFQYVGVNETQQIFQADNKCSNNMQLTLFIYNKAMNLKEYKDKSDLSEIKEMAEFQRQYLFDLIAKEIRNMARARTQFTSTPYYLYHLEQIQWQNSLNASFQLITTEFLEEFYYFSLLVFENIEDQEKAGIVQHALDSMKRNFPSLQKVSEDNLSLYKKLFKSTMTSVINMLWAKIITSSILFAVLLIVLYKHYKGRHLREKSVFTYFQQVCKKNIDNLKVYFNQTFVSFTQKMKGKDLSEEDPENRTFMTQLENQFTSIAQKGEGKLEIQTERMGKTTIRLIEEKTFKLQYILLLIFLLFTGVNIYLFTRNTDIFSSSENMMNNINALLTSQNEVLESYFQLKSEYIISGKTSINPKLIKNLLSKMSQNEVKFNKIITQSINTFADSDTAYKDDMIRLLVDNVCSLSKNLVSSEMNQKCTDEVQLSILENGLIVSMNFFQRTILDAVYLSEKQELQYYSFQTIKFKDIDYSIFFMFKIYQSIQIRIIQSLNQSLTNNNNLDTILFACQIVFLFGILVFLYFFKSMEKSFLSDFAGKLLLIPTPIMKVTKKLFKKINVEFQSIIN